MAIEDAVNRGRYDEIIISTLPRRISRWLHLDLVSKARGLGLPVTHVEAARGGGAAPARRSIGCRGAMRLATFLPPGADEPLAGEVRGERVVAFARRLDACSTALASGDRTPAGGARLARSPT